MKTADRESPNSRARLRNEPSRWGGRPEPSSLIYRGWKVRKFPVEGEVFFLTFPFIELIGTWRLRSRYTIWNPSNELTLYLGMNGKMPNCQLPPGEGSIGIIQFSLEVRVLEPGFLFV